MGGETHQYYPELTYDNHTVEAEKTPEEGYHLTEDLADKAISFIADAKESPRISPSSFNSARAQRTRRITCLKNGPTSTRANLTTAGDKLRERTFARQKELGIVPADAQLSRHDPDVPEWEPLSAEEKKLYARMMEVFAGFLTQTDYHIGRLIEFLKILGEPHNTVIMAISAMAPAPKAAHPAWSTKPCSSTTCKVRLEENLAALDKLGGPEFCNHYAWGWTWAGNTPFRRWKRETYRGGVSDPFIVHWPKGVKAKGEVRTQYVHAIDMVPTLLELLGIEAPVSIKGVTQSPIEGELRGHIRRRESARPSTLRSISK